MAVGLQAAVQEIGMLMRHSPDSKAAGRKGEIAFGPGAVVTVRRKLWRVNQAGNERHVVVA